LKPDYSSKSVNLFQESDLQIGKLKTWNA